MLNIINKTRSDIDLKAVERTAAIFLKKYKKESLELSIVFVGDNTIRKLNKIYRGKDHVTDILSFEGEDPEFGEIIISYQQIKRQSRLYSKNLNEELIFILIHGLLHLCGYTDDNENDRLSMIKLGERFIKKYL